MTQRRTTPEDDPARAREPSPKPSPTTSLRTLLAATKPHAVAQRTPGKPDVAQRTPGKPDVAQRTPGKPSRGIHVEPRAPRVNSDDRARELAASKRVAALVSGGLHFKIKRDGDNIQAQRGAGATKLVARLSSKFFVPEVTLDLRGQALSDVGGAIAGFIRVHHRRGVRQLLIALDAPTPSEALVDALSMGATAPLVRSFASAHASLGGTSALAVLLI